MRKNKLPGRIKAAFLTAALIGSTLLGTMAVQAAPETADTPAASEAPAERVVTEASGAAVELPIEQYFNISAAATAPKPTLKGTYTVEPVVGEIEVVNANLTDNETGSVKMTFAKIGAYEATLKIEAEATSTFGDSASFTDEYYLRAYVKNDGKGGFVTDVTAARDKDDPNTKVGEILFGICADDPPVKKVIEGDKKDEKFDFHMKATSPDTAPMPKDGESGEKVVNAGEGDVEFGWMFYDTAGDYSYDIWEEAGTDPNWTYDSTQYTKNVTITEGDDGKLAIESSYTDGSNTATFTNKYSEPQTTPTEAPTESPTEAPTEAPTQAPTDPATMPDGGSNGGGGSSGGGSNRGGSSRSETSNTSGTPTTPGEVLGATRDAAEDVGRGVLGAMRDPGNVLGAARDPGVLGAVRTGDSSAMITWAVILMLAVSGIVGWIRVYRRS